MPQLNLLNLEKFSVVATQVSDDYFLWINLQAQIKEMEQISFLIFHKESMSICQVVTYPLPFFIF